MKRCQSWFSDWRSWNESVLAAAGLARMTKSMATSLGRIKRKLSRICRRIRLRETAFGLTRRETAMPSLGASLSA